MQPWCTPFPIWNQSVFPCPVLTVASWPAYRFLKRQVRWSGIPTSFRIFQFIVIHTVKGFGIVNRAEIDVFLEFSCFFDDPADVGNLISNEGDGIPIELFQRLKDDAVKVLHSICQQIWKSQQWPRDWKRSVFIQCPKKAMPKNAQTTAQLHSFHMLVN